MSVSAPRLVRDPVHGLIRFEGNPVDCLLLALLDCPELQRLRRIQQLGFSNFVFPGATHTRFAHSLGVLWQAKKFLARIENLTGTAVDEENRTIILAGALLHDVGHGPFSHAFENVSKIRHERRTVEIVLDHETQVNATLSKRDAGLPERVAHLFPEGLGVKGPSALPADFSKHLAQIVSSQLDADRFDYLVRDSHFCGTGYGEFDPDWLLDHLLVDVERGRLCLSKKAHHAAEAYVFARYHMYQAVYFHKATRAAEVMCRLLLRRFVELRQQRDCGSFHVDGICPALDRVLRGAGFLADFLELDDHAMTVFVRACSQASDRTLSYLSHGLLNRRLYKCVDATSASQHRPDGLREFGAAVDRLIRGRSELPVEADYALAQDAPADTPYRIYDPDADNPNTQLYVEMESGKFAEFSAVSDIVNALKKKVSLLRYYVPMELRDDVQLLAHQFLGRENP